MRYNCFQLLLDWSLCTKTDCTVEFTHNFWFIAILLTGAALTAIIINILVSMLKSHILVSCGFERESYLEVPGPAFLQSFQLYLVVIISGWSERKLHLPKTVRYSWNFQKKRVSGSWFTINLSKYPVDLKKKIIMFTFSVSHWVACSIIQEGQQRC